MLGTRSHFRLFVVERQRSLTSGLIMKGFGKSEEKALYASLKNEQRYNEMKNRDEGRCRIPSCINSRVFGMFLMAMAGVLLTISNLFVQLAIGEKKARIPTLEIVFARSLIQLILVVPMLIVFRVRLINDKMDIAALIIMGISGFLSVTFIYLGIDRIPLGDATVITFTSPVFTTLFAYALLSESCSIVDGMCGICSFIGVVIAARPSFIFGKRHGITSITFHREKLSLERKEELHLMGIGHVLLGAVFLSLYYVLTRKIGLKQHFLVNIFYPSLFGSIFGPIIMLSYEEPVMIPGCWKVLLYVLLVGLSGLTGLILLALSLRLEDAGPLILIRNLDIVYAFTFQYWFMGILPSKWSISGGTIIMLSTSVIIGKRWLVLVREEDRKPQYEEEMNLMASED